MNANGTPLKKNPNDSLKHWIEVICHNTHRLSKGFRRLKKNEDIEYKFCITHPK